MQLGLSVNTLTQALAEWCWHDFKAEVNSFATGPLAKRKKLLSGLAERLSPRLQTCLSHDSQICQPLLCPFLPARLLNFSFQLTPRFALSLSIPILMSTITGLAFPDYINQRYKRSLGLVRNLPKNSLFQPSNADKLKLYGLYKQASFGDVNTPQPDRWDLLNRAKWYCNFYCICLLFS